MISKICNILSYIIIICLLALAALFFVPRIFGYEVLAVVSGSMEPTIHVGSVVYTKEQPFSEYKVNDIVTYQLSDNMLVTHRVVDINDDKTELTMKGDANNAIDKTKVNKTNIVGKVYFYLPLLGYLTLYMNSALGIAIICGIIFILLILYFLPEIFEKDDENNEKN